jgi:DNA-binding NtrC family response regulator
VLTLFLPGFVDPCEDLRGGRMMDTPCTYPEVDKEETTILVIEDDPSLARLLESYLQQQSYQVTSCHTAPEAKAYLTREIPDLILLDLALPPTNKVSEGLDLMTYCLRNAPSAKLIIITGEGTVDTAMACIRKGAEDYFEKPIELEKLSVICERALQRQKLEAWMEVLNRQRVAEAQLGRLIGQSFPMQQVFAQIRQAAARPANVLILGESGTGKGLAAETIHALSDRNEKPFVKVNCTALSEGLLESELFGHKRGSFTGALRNNLGKFEYADGGTLFLDEIGELPTWIQAKLLHAVEDKEIQRIGENRPIRVNTRIIAATNTNMKEQVAKNMFRRDLYYRLETIKIVMPPLSKRDWDIPLLSDEFLREFNQYRYKGFSLSAYEKLYQYNWPGNVRELRSVIYRTMGKAPEGGWIESHHLELDCDLEDTLHENGPRTLRESLERYERTLLLAALRRNCGNVTRTAEDLQLTRSGLHKKIIRFRIRKHEYL